VRTRKLELACPVCGSGEVFYTCTPNCCFNHVCNNCGSTFEPVTKARGAVVKGIAPPEPGPEAADPTVACGRCESTAVYMLEDGGVGCAQCGSRLEIEYTEVARNEG
jgi:DNA-directed RNA polymerase subunit RPC12/RpoP